VLLANGAAGQVLLKGSVTSRDSGQFRMLPFEVPAGTRRVDVQLTFTGRDQGTQLYLGIFDPIMYRGAGRLSFTISEYDATPPFAPGPIVPGTWHLALGVVNVNPERTSDYTARIDFSTSGRPAHRHRSFVPSPAGTRATFIPTLATAMAFASARPGRTFPAPPSKLVEAAAARHWISLPSPITTRR